MSAAEKELTTRVKECFDGTATLTVEHLLSRVRHQDEAMLLRVIQNNVALIKVGTVPRFVCTIFFSFLKKKKNVKAPGPHAEAPTLPRYR